MKIKSDVTGEEEEKRISDFSGISKFQISQSDKRQELNEPTIGQILSYSNNEVGVICKYVTLYDLFQSQVNAQA